MALRARCSRRRAIETASHTRSNNSHDGRRRVLSDFSAKYAWVCSVARQQLFGTSLRVIRSVDDDLRKEAVTGEEAEVQRAWCREAPANKAPEWVIACIHEHLDTYCYAEPDAKTGDGRGVVRPTSDDAEGKARQHAPVRTPTIIFRILGCLWRSNNDV